MSSASRKIHIKKQKHNFSSAHFITFNENECETLHGHNYYVTIEIYGGLNPHHYIIDFKIVKKGMRAICDSFDHKTLIAVENPHLNIRETKTQVEVSFKNREYSFPKEDVVMLPLPNTTVELLSEHICGSLKKYLEQKGYLANIDSIEVGVEETEGQMASFKIEL